MSIRLGRDPGRNKGIDLKMNGDRAESAETISVSSEASLCALVVGVGGGVGDVSAVANLLSGLARVANITAVICLAQQEAADDEALLEKFRAAAGMPAELVVDGGAVLARHLYLVPATMLVTIDDGRFKSRPSPEPLGNRGRIDSLLVSLANAYKERAVAILLTGTGSVGALGAITVKEQGGLAIAQQPPEPGGALLRADNSASAVADFALPVERIAGCIADHVEYAARREQQRTADAAGKKILKDLARLAAIIRDRTGHDFHGYKQNTFMRRVQRRMQVTHRDSVEDYAHYLKENSDEVHNLFHDMLIGVTQFFRDRKEFEFFEEQVIPKLFEGKTAADQVRVWVLGCATGEEAYSLAFLMREHMATLEKLPHVQIFATDIDGRALASARAGRYSDAVVGDISPERLERWFVREGDTYCVAKELREMCIFSQHNLLRDAPFSRLDLVSCRNLLIYLNAELQDRVIPLFHFALRPGGFLFLGNSENVTRHAKLFVPIDRGFRVFRRLENTARVRPEFPLSALGSQRSIGPSGSHRQSGANNLTRSAERIAERHAPAYVVVDRQLEVLHFSGGMGRFLDPSTGVASLNLLNLVHRDLRLDLGAAMDKAMGESTMVSVPPSQVAETSKAAAAIRIIVEPVRDEPDEPQHFVVIFQDSRIAFGTKGGAPASPPNRDEHVEQLEGELRLTRERLQATIEELESTNEELKSSNEEYQSINEELQSANEELETSKEELQSVNEELQTVNGELAHRVHELARANSDLKNLLESTQIATIFLDNDLRIKNFTPAVTEIFHLIDSDLGRPINHIASRIAYDDLVEDVRRVMRTLSTIEREIEDTRSDTRYLVRVLPYRSVDNFIAGVVLTFLDVSATARVERALRASEERLRIMTKVVPAFLFTVKPDLHVDYMNPPYYDYTGLSEGSALGLGWLAAVHPDDLEATHRLWERASVVGEPYEAEQRIRGANGTYRWFMSRAEPERDAAGRVIRWIGSSWDIHAQRTAADRQRLLLAELQHRVKNILAVVRSIFARSVGDDGAMEAGADHFRGRLDSLARTQNVLARTPEGGIDLEEMVRDELTSHGAKSGDQIRVAGPPVRLRQKAAEALGLAVHELATNAAKYGALAHDSGRIAVTWRLYDRGAGVRLAWKWVESGVKLIDPFPSRVGFGRELIEQGLPYQLGATTALEFARGGVRCAIEVPLNERVVVLDESENGGRDQQ